MSRSHQFRLPGARASQYALTGVLSLLIACAPGDVKAGLGPDDASITQITVSPSSGTVPTDGSLAYSVSALHGDGSTSVPQVAWSATGGSISTDGVYVPGGVLGDYVVVASLVGEGLVDTATVTVVAVGSPIVSLTVSPASVALTSGETQQFLVTATRQDGSIFAPAASWTATGGTISSGGLYTAGNTAGTFRVIARQQGGTLADTASVTVSPPVLQAVILSPPATALYTGGVQQFSVSGQWSNGATTPPAVTYSATGGSISTGGLYTAGSSAGIFRVIATQQGGTLADTSVVNLTAPPPPGSNDMYFNSAEAGCGTDPNLLLCDDFEDGDWYIKDYDQAMASGGLLQTDGWGGTIYANPITPAGAAVCGGAGFGGTNCAATSGYRGGGTTDRNMADHGFAGGVTNLDEAYFRLYFQPQADYVGGHEKMFDFIRASGSAQMVALCFNAFGGGEIECIPYLHQDDGLPGQPNAWMGSNVASPLRMVNTHWYFIEMHVKLNAPGSYNGIFEWWMNDCGVGGTGCTGTPTLRGRYTNVLYRSAGESDVMLGGIWIEGWSNPVSTGTMYYDNVVAAKAGPIGFVR